MQSFYKSARGVTYAFLSKVIYVEFVEEEIDEESIFSFLLQFNWIILKQYALRDNGHETIRVAQYLLNIFDMKKFQNGLDAIVDSILFNNAEGLNFIYENVYLELSQLQWQKNWAVACRFFFEAEGYEMSTCATLITIVNECLGISSHEKSVISVMLLHRLQMSGIV